jgi:2-polyprenyl-3-methyl-5-hydroxy-6-metoxy-1,4-benzoquinol methylase
LWWLDPRPAPNAISDSYDTYFTHVEEVGTTRRGLRETLERAILDGGLGYSCDVGKLFRILGRVLALLPSARDEAARRVMWLTASMRGRLLDVGSGNGAFLARMRDLGWKVEGVEPDARAVDISRRRFSLDVFHGTLDQFTPPAASYDGITLNHVIEHVPDPIALLQRCESLLKPGGRLVIATPNVASLGARFFRSTWRGLEVPRHLCLFSKKSLTHLLSSTQLRIVVSRTPARSARWMWSTSSNAAAAHSGPSRIPKPIRSILPWIFQLVEQTATLFVPVGEEVLLIATKD